MVAFPKAEKKPNGWLVFGYCLLIAAGCLVLCSKSSPLYPLNDWSDANIYFTMGKGMMNGRVLYQDIYDHKGPLLYALHGLCYLVSPLSFLGVFWMEILCAALFLLSVWKMLDLYGASRGGMLVLPVLAMLIYSSVSLQQGDSAEELCLPMLSWSLYALLSYCRAEPQKPMPARTLMLHGMLCGCVLWVKFTMLGLHAAWILLVCIQQLVRKQYGAAWRSLLWYGVGIGVATLPWLLYFGLNGAILPWLKTYLYDNLFLYSKSEEATGFWQRGKAVVKAGLEWLLQNPGCTFPLLCGFFWLTKKGTRWEKIALWCALGLAALGVFIGGKSYLYYGFVLAAFAGLGLLPLGWLLERYGALWKKQNMFVMLLAAVWLGSLAGSYAISPNPRTSFLQPKSETMQYQLAEKIAEAGRGTLLNYGFMDAGFYTASGIVPNVKYFHQTNVPLAEMLQEQNRYVEEGLCDYVITRGKNPPGLKKRYRLVAEASSPEGFWYSTVYLYKRIP